MRLLMDLDEDAACHLRPLTFVVLQWGLCISAFVVKSKTLN